MAKKTKASAAATASTGAPETEGAAVLPAAGDPNSGIQRNSMESVRGPIVSDATTLKGAHGVEGAGAVGKGRKPKGPVRIKSTVPRYTAFGTTFRGDDKGSVIQPDDFTDEQWASLGENRYLVITKAASSDADY